MLSILGNVFNTATRTERHQHLTRTEWEARFCPRHGRRHHQDAYRFNPYRDFW